MSINPLDQIKAAQIAAAADAGELNPYQKGFVAVVDEVQALDPFNALDQIKAAQLVDAESSGENPYHKQAVAQSSATVAPKDREHYQAAMDADLNSLKVLKTLDEKQAAKKTMLATYWDFVSQYVEQLHNYPNSIAVQVMVWLFDTLDIERGLYLALYLIKQGGQQMPIRFERRDLETFVCDAMYDWANGLLKKDQSASPYLDALVAEIGTSNWQLSPPVKSKMYAILAKHKNREGSYRECEALCELAEQANPEGAGVKTLKAQAHAKLPVTE